MQDILQRGLSRDATATVLPLPQGEGRGEGERSHRFLSGPKNPKLGSLFRSVHIDEFVEIEDHAAKLNQRALIC
jgi:hypothetical protein